MRPSTRRGRPGDGSRRHAGEGPEQRRRHLAVRHRGGEVEEGRRFGRSRRRRATLPPKPSPSRPARPSRCARRTDRPRCGTRRHRRPAVRRRRACETRAGSAPPSPGQGRLRHERGAVAAQMRAQAIDARRPGDRLHADIHQVAIDAEGAPRFQSCHPPRRLPWGAVGTAEAPQPGDRGSASSARRAATASSSWSTCNSWRRAPASSRCSTRPAAGLAAVGAALHPQLGEVETPAVRAALPRASTPCSRSMARIQ